MQPNATTAPRRIGRPPVEKIERTCETCQQTFLVYPSTLKQNASRFCGQPCFLASKQNTLAARFWAKVDKNGPVPAHRPDLGPCWLWTASRYHTGHGMLGVGSNKFQGAHRVAWTLAHGPIAAGMMVCHACDNRPCVRESHLFLGTQSQNIRDMDQKGRRNVARTPRGPRGKREKLTVLSVRAIRQRYAAGETNCSALAREYGVSVSTVIDTVQRATWKHIP